MDYKIIISGLSFNATHGLYKEEKEKEQLFKVDISLVTSLDSSFNDDISNIVNYEEISNEVKKVMNSKPVNLIETLAKQIMHAAPKEIPLVAQRTYTNFSIKNSLFLCRAPHI